MKTDEEVLKECVKIAVGNGFKYEDPEYIDWVCGCNFEYDIDDNTIVSDGLIYLDVDTLLFNHSFCRKLFGEQKAITEEQYNKLDDLTAAIFSKGEGYENMECRWQHHIQKLALSTDRISYLRKWLNNSSKA